MDKGVLTGDGSEPSTTHADSRRRTRAWARASSFLCVRNFEGIARPEDGRRQVILCPPLSPRESVYPQLNPGEYGAPGAVLSGCYRARRSVEEGSPLLGIGPTRQQRTSP
jgi:hypothetical protein